MDGRAEQLDELRLSPAYIALIRQRDAFARRMTWLVMATFMIYFGALAWLPDSMAAVTPEGGSVGLWLSVIGIAMGIAFAVLYTWRMNTCYDPALRRLLASLDTD
ncbi:MAG: DUF485 domain-containing protein [Gammaproteobacteria bacterium]|nr:DUF485 domain-containing protein [Gammaproteobacteria bacterium]NNL99358.1 DUF485 domain-containing protein [Gammaproteobacteria bacterium]